MASTKAAAAPKGSATTIEEIHARMNDAMHNSKVSRNVVITKKELPILLDYKNQSDAIKIKCASLQQDLDHIDRIISKQQSRDTACSERHLKLMLEKSSDNPSDRCMKVFNLVIYREAMRLAVQDLIVKSKTASQVDVGKIPTGKPGFYNILKPQMRKRKLNFDKELENATKLSHWISERAQYHSTATRQTRQSQRRVVAKAPRVAEQAASKERESELLVQKCNSLLDKHRAVAEVPSYTTDLNLVDKLTVLLEELERLQKQRDETDRQEVMSNAPASWLLADGGDEADCGFVVPFHQPPEHQISRSKQTSAKKRIMTANSEDMISLVVCKQLISIDGQWKDLYRKLMSTKYQKSDVEKDIKSITDEPRSEESQAFEALKIWRQAFGRSMKTEKLKSELEELKRQDIIMNICDYEQRLSSGKLDPNSLCAVCRHCFY